MKRLECLSGFKDRIVNSISRLTTRTEARNSELERPVGLVDVSEVEPLVFDASLVDFRLDPEIRQLLDTMPDYEGD
ncbi:MAG: hypothetical protein AB7W16_08115 [Candidatus Obscuribacterales bacterium]